MPLTIVPNNALTVLVASTVNAVTTDEIELNPFYKYTLMGTTLTNNTESIDIEIYDSSTDRLFHFDLESQHGKIKIVIKSNELVKRGSVNEWLKSDSFDIKYPVSIEAEESMTEANELMRIDSGDVEKLKLINEKLN